MPKSHNTDTYLEIEGYWVSKGALEPQAPDNYILTQSVRKNLKDLVRVVSIGKLPVLLQVFMKNIVLVIIHALCLIYKLYSCTFKQIMNTIILIALASLQLFIVCVYSSCLII